MIKFLLAGALAVATPVFAQTNSNFVGTHVEAQTGLLHDDVTYGAAIGHDFALGDRATLGVDADATNIFDENGRTLGAGAKLGYALTPEVLAFGRVGYVNLDAYNQHLNGVAAGGGLQFSLTRNTYVNTEYRYTNYEQGVHSNAGLLGLGIRF